LDTREIRRYKKCKEASTPERQANTFVTAKIHELGALKHRAKLSGYNLYYPMIKPTLVQKMKHNRYVEGSLSPIKMKRHEDMFDGQIEKFRRIVQGMEERNPTIGANRQIKDLKARLAAAERRASDAEMEAASAAYEADWHQSMADRNRTDW